MEMKIGVPYIIQDKETKSPFTAKILSVDGEDALVEFSGYNGITPFTDTLSLEGMNWAISDEGDFEVISQSLPEDLFTI